MRTRRIPISFRSAFALPIVLMVSLALATLIAIMLDRFMAQTRSVAGIVRSYENYHAGRGLHQLLEAWLRNTSASRLAGRLGEGGLAMSVKLSEGMTPTANSAETAKIYLSDAQGSILNHVATVAAEDAALAQAIIAAANELDAGGVEAPGGEGTIARRESGPLGVSLRSASARTIRAVVMGATAGEKTEEVLAELLRAREDPSVNANALSEVANKTGLTAEARAKLLKAITVEPQVWNIVAEVEADRLLGGGPILRYKGVAIMNNTTANAGGVTSAKSVIRQWTREDLR